MKRPSTIFLKALTILPCFSILLVFVKYIHGALNICSKFPFEISTNYTSCTLRVNLVLDFPRIGFAKHPRVLEI